MFAGKPVIGIVGGIGSGKSFIAGLFGEMGCHFIDADVQVRQACNDPTIRQTLRQWWGDAVFAPDGSLNRKVVAARVFGNESERKRLEALIHPVVAADRRRRMENLAQNPQVLAFVWDTPLLLEVGLRDQCDAVVYVDTPPDLRLERVARSRGWDEAELNRRENLQWPLDRKRQISDYVISNTADAGDARRQVRDVLSRVLARVSHSHQGRSAGGEHPTRD